MKRRLTMPPRQFRLPRSIYIGAKGAYYSITTTDYYYYYVYKAAHVDRPTVDCWRQPATTPGVPVHAFTFTHIFGAYTAYVSVHAFYTQTHTHARVGYAPLKRLASVCGVDGVVNQQQTFWQTLKIRATQPARGFSGYAAHSSLSFCLMVYGGFCVNGVLTENTCSHLFWFGSGWVNSVVENEKRKRHWKVMYF